MSDQQQPSGQPAPDQKPTCAAEHGGTDGKTARCVLDMGHGGRMHRDADGFQWFAGGGRGRWRR